ncbi:MAG TPA: MATE family efflux transporter [Rhizomicrobium sp.]|nr:MATE family efflux transporter [Rhizomicrobium sp.]
MIRARTVLALSAPLIAFFLIQNAVNLAVLALLGQLGTATLAGAGISGAIYGMVLALLFGFDTGVQVSTARAAGAGSIDGAAQALVNALSLSIPLGATLTALVYLLGPTLVAGLTHDSAAIAAGSTYLRAEAPSILFLAVTIPINGFWIGTGAPKYALLVSLVVAPLQVALSWVLLAKWGVAGVGVAFSIAMLAGVCVQTWLARKYLFRRPEWSGAMSIARIGWPVSVQQAFLQIGFIIAFAVVAQLGTSSIAILNVLTTLTLVPVQSATGLGTAAGALAGQALGRGDAADAKRWGWQIAMGGALLMMPLGLIAVVAPRELLSFFLKDPRSVTLAVLPVQMLGAGVGIDAFGRILGFALRGVGATRAAAGIAFMTQWLALLPLMWVAGIRLGFGLNGIVAVQVALTIVEAALFAWIWHRGRWTSIRIGRDETTTDISASRIVVLGGAGAGKSTLARAIGEKLVLPVVHLDRLVIGPGWRRIDNGTARRQLADALTPGHWVVEGVYPALQDITLPDADLVVWIEQPALVRLFRAWRKTRIHKDKPRADRPDGCAEGFSAAYACTVFNFGRFNPSLQRDLAAATPARVIRLKGDRAVRGFLTSLHRLK